jgi:crotonobetainyl-CoA:carnitine CoA-transferase CaiB-like acyl-CoA transferase
MCTILLGKMSADVIKAEEPGSGDDARLKSLDAFAS